MDGEGMEGWGQGLRRDIGGLGLRENRDVGIWREGGRACERLMRL